MNDINEASLSRIWQFVEEDKYHFGIVSAFRIGLSDKKNKELHSELKKNVRSLGYGYIEMKGGYKGKTELSLFLGDVDKKDIIKFGVDNEQETVIYKNETEFVYIGTNKDIGIGKVVKRFKFKSGKDNIVLAKKLVKEYYSQLLKGSHREKKFAFTIQERDGDSFFKVVMRSHGDPLGDRKWYTIYEEGEIK